MLYAVPASVEFVSETPRIEISAGIVKITARSGKAPISERAMSVPCFARYIERAQHALRQHAAGDEIVIVED
jgi:hypothetical protein